MNKFGLKDIEATEKEISSDIGMVWNKKKNHKDNTIKDKDNTIRNLFIFWIGILILYFLLLYQVMKRWT
jgi:hypothetical protein